MCSRILFCIGVLGDVGVSTGKYSPRAPSGAGQISKRSDTQLKNANTVWKKQRRAVTYVSVSCVGLGVVRGSPQENIARELRREPVKSQNGRITNSTMSLILEKTKVDR